MITSMLLWSLSLSTYAIKRSVNACVIFAQTPWIYYCNKPTYKRPSPSLLCMRRGNPCATGGVLNCLSSAPLFSHGPTHKAPLRRPLPSVPIPHPLHRHIYKYIMQYVYPQLFSFWFFFIKKRWYLLRTVVIQMYKVTLPRRWNY